MQLLNLRGDWTRTAAKQAGQCVVSGEHFKSGADVFADASEPRFALVAEYKSYLQHMANKARNRKQEWALVRRILGLRVN